MKISVIKQGDVFSEVSHYIALRNGISGNRMVEFKHIETGEAVEFNNRYVENVLESGDQFDHVIKVGKEDKFWTRKQIDEAIENSEIAPFIIPQLGDLREKGIRTIWEELVSPHVFTVCFKKADSPKSQKLYKREIMDQINEGIDYIENAKLDKKSMSTAYGMALEKIQNTPILPYIPGEDRILRGYKVQFVSRDGRYDCVDMDLLSKGKGSAVRPVNINTIQYLIYKSIKYEVE